MRAVAYDRASKVVVVKPLSEHERSERFEQQRQRISDRYLHASDSCPATSARGLHHKALLSSDVERTVQFYQELLEFPLTAIAEHRDYRGSSHFFFDIGNNNLLAFFDFPAWILAHIKKCSAGCTTGDQCRAGALETSAGQADRGRS